MGLESLIPQAGSGIYGETTFGEGVDRYVLGNLFREQAAQQQNTDWRLKNMKESIELPQNQNQLAAYQANKMAGYQSNIAKGIYDQDTLAGRVDSTNVENTGKIQSGQIGQMMQGLDVLHAAFSSGEMPALALGKLPPGIQQQATAFLQAAGSPQAAAKAIEQVMGQLKTRLADTPTHRNALALKQREGELDIAKQRVANEGAIGAADISAKRAAAAQASTDAANERRYAVEIAKLNEAAVQDKARVLKETADAVSKSIEQYKGDKAAQPYKDAVKNLDVLRNRLTKAENDAEHYRKEAAKLAKIPETPSTTVPTGAVPGIPGMTIRNAGQPAPAPRQAPVTSAPPQRMQQPAALGRGGWTGTVPPAGPVNPALRF